jgi:hypothetical protein
MLIYSGNTNELETWKSKFCYITNSKLYKLSQPGSSWSAAMNVGSKAWLNSICVYTVNASRNASSSAPLQNKDMSSH